ncbi:hypothetical protein GCK72_008883 [Caenorhabditis remanei]|uniref:Uncharacterized protein n=1 Tax=Caenorhabditis remanei TaxID=31234 RepID=A0A6A5H1I5_CAERE|nr:hypothetical protein GCK72_008883 [Caenorhabditis remanei]KAF1760634.1 hypothetical protein GCK72_008883 [Caenorhabditis remanei]
MITREKGESVNHRQCLEVGFQIELTLGLSRHHSWTLILGDTLLEEVGLSIYRDVLHEVEWILHIVQLVASEFRKQVIGDELDVLRHQTTVHANHVNWKCLCQELLLDADGVLDNLEDTLLC